MVHGFSRFWLRVFAHAPPLCSGRKHHSLHLVRNARWHAHCLLASVMAQAAVFEDADSFVPVLACAAAARKGTLADHLKIRVAAAAILSALVPPQNVQLVQVPEHLCGKLRIRHFHVPIPLQVVLWNCEITKNQRYLAGKIFGVSFKQKLMQAKIVSAKQP